MWNETLKRINRLTPKQAIKQWSGDVKTLELVSEGINRVYRFEKGNQGYFLRITHIKLRKEAELLAALSYQRHLFDNQVPVCEPLLSNNHLWFEKIKQENDIFIAHVCREVPGNPIHFNYNENEIYRNWGIALGKLHKAAQSYQPNEHQYTRWNHSIAELNDYAQSELSALQDLLSEVSEYFNKRAMTPQNFGLTHGDHREGNVLTDGKAINIIDFDLPSFNWFMEDFSRPFFNPIIQNDKNWQEKFIPYLEGYLSIMPEESIDLSALEKQIKMKCLEIYLWTKNNWSSEIAPGGENTSLWLEKIYQKIVDHSWVNELRF